MLLCDVVDTMNDETYGNDSSLPTCLRCVVSEDNVGAVVFGYVNWRTSSCQNARPIGLTCNTDGCPAVRPMNELWGDRRSWPHKRS